MCVCGGMGGGGGVILIQISEIREGGPQFLKSVNGGKGVVGSLLIHVHYFLPEQKM